MFNYKSFTQIRGFFVRKHEWKSIIEDSDHREVVQVLKEKMTLQYNALCDEILKSKNSDLEFVDNRHDYEFIQCLIDKN
jgi:hypothetical protein